MVGGNRMIFDRRSGILLHPTSLPSKYGIGDLGYEAYRFVDFLKKGKQTLWQILPLGPVGYGESPYQSFSAFAGNPLLISIDKLIENNLLENTDIEQIPEFCLDKVEFNEIKPYKEKFFRKAFKKFKLENKPKDYIEFYNKNSFWLDDFVLFMAIKNYYNGVAWCEWDKDIAKREAAAMKKYSEMLSEDIEYQVFLQYIFFSQWKDLKKYANSQGISIVGDLPLFISNDSSDAWAQPQLFQIDEYGVCLKVAGVPPDYFSETGQFWGNPHYRWDVMEIDNYKWWRDRFATMLETIDVIRIDHFRGFESYWEIPGTEKTAVNGRWVKAPGSKLFNKVIEYLGDIPIIAEDLGFITPEVENLKNEFSFPGMKILQFTFGAGAEERFLPHNYEDNSVVYTGTHDNDTTIGWLKKSIVSEPEAVKQMKQYLNLDEDVSEQEFCWSLIDIAYKSKSNTVIIPMQDILCLGSEARMNIPGTIGGNWDWRLRENMLSNGIIEKLADLTTRYKRR
jgi:4-alpha-glucanotransferase